MDLESEPVEGVIETAHWPWWEWWWQEKTTCSAAMDIIFRESRQTEETLSVSAVEGDVLRRAHGDHDRFMGYQ